MAVRMLRRKCKEMPKTLTSICRWLNCSKNPLHEQKFQKPLELTIFQFANRLKIQFDSFLTACTVLGNWTKSIAKQGYIYTFSFLAKIVASNI